MGILVVVASIGKWILVFRGYRRHTFGIQNIILEKFSMTRKTSYTVDTAILIQEHTNQSFMLNPEL